MKIIINGTLFVRHLEVLMDRYSRFWRKITTHSLPQEVWWLAGETIKCEALAGGSCSGSIPGSAGLQFPSTPPQSSGGFWAPVWLDLLVTWHACIRIYHRSTCPNSRYFCRTFCALIVKVWKLSVNVSKNLRSTFQVFSERLTVQRLRLKFRLLWALPFK